MTFFTVTCHISSFHEAVAYWNIEWNQEVVRPDQNISDENCFHLPPIFQNIRKPRQHRMYFRVVMLQPWRYSAEENMTFNLLF